MTSTTKYADLVLPVTTIFEDTSLMTGVRSHYIQLMEKAVEPVGEAKPDYWIFARLAERFGFGDMFNKPIEHYIDVCLEGTGITREQLAKGPIKPVEGQWVTTYNDRGEHRAIAIVTRQIKQGVVCLDNGWWEEQGGSSSHVTNDAYEPLGFGHCCNSTLVNVKAEA